MRLGHSRVFTHANRVVAGAAITVLFADQLSKALVVTLLGPTVHPRVGRLSLRLVRNTGASFGLAAGHRLFVTALAIVATAGVAVLAIRSHERAAALAWGVTLGGALGNLADRFARSPALGSGAVVDWIHIAGYPSTFNLADLAIRAGSLAALVTTARSALTRTRASRARRPPAG